MQRSSDVRFVARERLLAGHKMEHPLDLVLVHLCSLLAPVGLLLLHAVLPGGFVGSPLLAFSLLSLLLSAATLLASRLLPSPRGGLTKVPVFNLSNTS